MKVGEYIRTERYGIKKIIGFSSTLEENFIACNYNNTTNVFINEKDIIKSSPNIIDLIEIGDYVNGVLICSIGEDIEGKYVFGYSRDGFEGETMFYKNNIKSIVTKEQFSQMEYRIEE